MDAPYKAGKSYTLSGYDFFLCIFILQFSIFLSVIFLSVSSQNPIFSEINAIHQFLSQTQTFRGQQGQEGIYQRHISICCKIFKVCLTILGHYALKG